MLKPHKAYAVALTKARFIGDATTAGQFVVLRKL